jgi:hypothetical protein
MIDCGKRLVDGLNWCEEGNGIGVSMFIQNYGVELGDNYRYEGRDGGCPFDKKTDIKTTGYIRTEGRSVCFG